VNVRLDWAADAVVASMRQFGFLGEGAAASVSREEIGVAQAEKWALEDGGGDAGVVRSGGSASTLAGEPCRRYGLQQHYRTRERLQQGCRPLRLKVACMHWPFRGHFGMSF